MSVYISGPKVYTERGPMYTELLLKAGKIAAMGAPSRKDAEVYQFPRHYHVIPGMIDLHIHGAMGADVMDGTPEALERISHALVSEGTTGFLATTMTESVGQIEAALDNVRHFKASGGAEVLGVHLEGPFLAAKRMGAQCAEHLRAPDIALFAKWQALSGNNIKLVTVAPELAQATGFIQYLRQQGVIVSLGHSDATFQEAQAGIAAGASYATHLFNAMRPIHHREPGIATAILLDERVTAELVLDGFHLHPSMVQLALKMKGKSRLVLVSDAMRAKCLGDGDFSLGGQPVIVKDGMACLPDGTIAGSVLKLNQALRHFINYTHSSMEEAIMLTSTNPARMLGLAHRKGSIALGKDADLVVLNEHFEVVATFCQGIKVSARELR